MLCRITGSLKPCTLDDPEGRTKSEYNKRLEQQTNSATRCGVKSWVRSSCVRPPPSHVCAEVTGGEDDDAFCRLIYQFTVNKMKY